MAEKGIIYKAADTKAKVRYVQMCMPGAEFDVDDEVDSIENLVNGLKSVELKKIDVEYKAKTEALPLSLPVRTAKYRLKRFQSDDKGTYGEDGVKLDLGAVLAKLSDLKPEATAEHKDDLSFDKMLNDFADESKSRIAKSKKKQELEAKIKEKKSKEAKLELAKERRNDYLLRCRNIAMAAEEDVQDYKTEKEADYRDEERLIDQQAKTAGEAKGAQDVQKFNNAVEKQAKKILDGKRVVMAQANIAIKQAVQIAKLKIFAKLGI